MGALSADCVKIDGAVYFVQRGGRKVIRLDYNASNDNYQAIDLMRLHEDICMDSTTDGIKRIVVTRMPETRLWAVLNSGEVRVLLIDAIEEIAAWSRIKIADSAASGTDTITDVLAIPGTGEDRIYFVVKRGSTYYLEKLAKLEEAQGDTTSYHADAAIWVVGPTTTPACAHITNASTVRVWSADNAGKDLGDFTVSAGAITLPSQSTLGVVVGLTFNADYTSNKLSGYSEYSVQGDYSRIVDVAVIARDIVPDGITVGPSFSDLQSLPDYEDGTTLIGYYKHEDYDHAPFEFNGTKATADKFYMRAVTPITVLALAFGVHEARDKSR
jgi:hypothetical protein